MAELEIIGTITGYIPAYGTDEWNEMVNVTEVVETTVEPTDTTTVQSATPPPEDTPDDPQNPGEKIVIGLSIGIIFLCGIFNNYPMVLFPKSMILLF